MKVRTLIAASLMISVIFITGCMEEDTLYPEGHFSMVPGMNDLVNSSNEFSFEMYRELLNGSDNLFFSPYSITIALGMAFEGARGLTAEEILNVINLPEDNESRREMVRALQSTLNPGDADYELSTANAYWLRQGEDLNDIYQSTLENDYLAYGQQLDFVGDSPGAADIINTWVEDQTNDRIKDLISPGLLGPLTYLVLTNAIYFKASWQWEFDESATKEKDFTLSDGNTVSANMMHMCDEEVSLEYAENDDVQMLRLPYTDDELSMYIMLPKGNDIGVMEENLGGEYISELRDNLSSEYVEVFLPSFKFDLKYKLRNDLMEMGMPTTFGWGADFSGIKESGASELYISEVIHQSFVEVNEEGTEAAAATAVIMKDYGGGGGEQPTMFNADHPFLFFIEHEASGQILFMGKVEDPTSSAE